MEFLTLQLDLAEADMSIQPLKRSSIRPPTHILFADDVLLFCKADRKSMTGVQSVLQTIQTCAGLVVNLEKSRIFLSKGVKRKAEIAAVLGVTLSSLPIKYLGLPLSNKYPNTNLFKPLVDTCKRRISHWGTKILSAPGKVQLINSVLHNTISFWIQAFRLPSSIVRQLESLFANFFWNSRFHATSWDNICKPKSEGGLGLRRIKEMNTAGGAKLLWSIINRPADYWPSFMRSKYLKDADISAASPNPLQSGTWKFALSTRQHLPPNTVTHIQGNPTWQSSPKSPGLRFFWNLTRAKHAKSTISGLLWFPNHCPKMSTCLWRATNNSLMTKEFMISRTMSTDSVCPLCKRLGETTEHLFFNCDYTIYIWSICRLKLKLPQKQSYILLEEMELLKSKFKKRSGIKKLARILIPATVWHIWKERNSRVFDKKERPKTSIILELTASIRILCQGEQRNTMGSDIWENWM